MSLFVDLNKYGKKLLNKLATMMISVLVLGFTMYIILPDLLGNRAQPPPPHPQKTPEQIKTDSISQQTEKTRLRLIMRTGTHLADTLGIPQQDIILNGVTNKTWTDTGLECPQPQNPSIKPLVTVPQRTSLPGWLITWKLGNTVYEYNTSVRGDWILCNKIEIPENVYQNRIPASDTTL